MRTIYKYSVRPQFSNYIRIPTGGKFLCAGYQDGWPRVWFEVDTLQEVEQRCLYAVGTGHDVRDNWKYLGSAQESCEPYVWHIYTDV